MGQGARGVPGVFWSVQDWVTSPDGTWTRVNLPGSVMCPTFLPGSGLNAPAANSRLCRGRGRSLCEQKAAQEEEMWLFSRLQSGLFPTTHQSLEAPTDVGVCHRLMTSHHDDRLERSRSADDELAPRQTKGQQPVL